MAAAGPSGAAGEVAWGVVVPVKRLAQAKTRLAAFGDDLRERLALAFAEDVVLATLDCPPVRRVLVVTDDERAARALAALGATVIPDSPDAGLNPALEHGVALLRAGAHPGGVATVSADLPALRSADLAALLQRVDARAFVSDAGGTGTTVLAAAPGHPLDPRYGRDSRRRHLGSGAVELVAGRCLRQDVDTPDDLRVALALGVGPRTAAVAAELAGLDAVR